MKVGLIMRKKITTLLFSTHMFLVIVLSQHGNGGTPENL